MSKRESKKNTSWQKVSGWYNKLVGEKGHYYHQHLIIPGVLRLLELKRDDSVLDIGCGQGVFARSLPKDILYVGVDIASSLVNFAKNNDENPQHQYMASDAARDLPIDKKDFTHATIILALQNIENTKAVLLNVSKHLIDGGRLVIVLNHPCFRIPRQSGWDISQKGGMQYRWVNRYMTPLKIPINMHPGEKNSPVTWTFHYPLSYYSQFLKESGFVVLNIEEWVSDKVSRGEAARMENRSRQDIPLFLTVVARKD